MIAATKSAKKSIPTPLDEAAMFNSSSLSLSMSSILSVPSTTPYTDTDTDEDSVTDAILQDMSSSRVTDGDDYGFNQSFGFGDFGRTGKAASRVLDVTEDQRQQPQGAGKNINMRESLQRNGFSFDDAKVVRMVSFKSQLSRMESNTSEYNEDEDFDRSLTFGDFGGISTRGLDVNAMETQNETRETPQYLAKERLKQSGFSFETAKIVRMQSRGSIKTEGNDQDDAFV